MNILWLSYNYLMVILSSRRCGFIVVVVAASSLSFSLSLVIIVDCGIIP